jgi:hypothetical protein
MIEYKSTLICMEREILLRCSSIVAKFFLGYPWSMRPLRVMVSCALQILHPPGPQETGKPFYGSIMTLNVSPSSSGFLPGDSASVHDVECIIFKGGERDLIAFLYFIRILFYKLKAWLCFFLFLRFSL